LHTVSLDDNPTFTAVSYTWGEPTKTHSITCNEHRIGITSNLWWALREASYFDQPELVWADQVCIDQSNTDERSSQVQLMGRIYRQARRVWVSLGKGYAGEEMVAMKLCRLISTRADIARGRSGLLRYTGNHDPENHGLQPWTSAEWQSLRKLLLNPWFRRVWITQEFALASNPIMCISNIILELDILWNLQDNLRYLDLYSGFLNCEEDKAKSLKLSQAMSCIKSLCELREAVQKSKYLTLDALLSREIVRGATDPRDHIFAFRGLASDPTISELQPDYNIEPGEAFTRCCTYLVSHAESLNFLYEAGIYEKTLDLPSWVPDWMVLRETLSLGRHDRSPYSAHMPLFCAAQGIDAVAHVDDSVLVIRGSRIDNLATLGSFLPPVIENAQEEYRNLVEHWLSECNSLASDLMPVYRYESCDVALMRTLLTDNTHVPERYRQLDVDDYYAFKQITRLQTQGKPHLSDKWAERVTKSNRFEDCALARSRNRRFCLTEGGKIGQVPNCAQKGDEVWILLGATVPFILRRVGPCYLFVGECYIHGIMYGEAVSSAGWNLHDIRLV
jgi:Heterokaryon incompatibility protein (HET)